MTLTSALDRYLPEPAFNQKNGWIVDVKAGQVFLDNKKQDMLFYELAVNKITLNRNGRNFNSKEEVISFLQNSDFLNKLSFSEVEKKNSLNYFIPKINESPDKNFYYLTVLNESAIDEISQLKIDPKPERINMKYFAIYPTPVPVASTGEFIFPSIVSTDTKNYTVDVTGEFLVDSSMTVLWKN